jgi:hypothetical protein
MVKGVLVAKKVTQPYYPLRSPIQVALSGIFTTFVNGSLCQLEVYIQPDQRFSGSLRLKDDSYEIRGVVTGVNLLHGFILEPFEHKPIAMLRVLVVGDEMFLELDMPEVTDPYSKVCDSVLQA